MAIEIPIEIISIFCQVLYKEDGTYKTRDFALLGEEAKELERVLNSEDASLSVDWVDVAADIHQALSAIRLSLSAIQGGSLIRNVSDSMLIELDKLRAIPGVGAELERRAGQRVTAARRR